MPPIYPRSVLSSLFSVTSFEVPSQFPCVPDIAYGSRAIPQSIDGTRFITYCKKWISDGNVNADGCSFLHVFMTHVASELRHINSSLYPSWASRSLLQTKPFSPRSRKLVHSPLVGNPLQSLYKDVQESRILLKNIFSLPLPLFTVDYSISLDCRIHPLPIPIRSIERGLRENGVSMSFYARCLLFRCSSDSRLTLLPPFFSLQTYEENYKVSVFTIRTVIAREEDETVIYKRLFSPKRLRDKNKLIYDVHQSGRWIRQERDHVQVVPWSRVQQVYPSILHYERIDRSFVCSKSP